MDAEGWIFDRRGISWIFWEWQTTCFEDLNPIYGQRYPKMVPENSKHPQENSQSTILPCTASKHNYKICRKMFLPKRKYDGLLLQGAKISRHSIEFPLKVVKNGPTGKTSVKEMKNCLEIPNGNS